MHSSFVINLLSGRFWQVGFIISAFFLPCTLFSQPTWSTTNCPQSEKEAYTWYFGKYAGLIFNDQSDEPAIDTSQNAMDAIKGTAVICDSMGNLLFFTDGTKVWDRTMNLMPNATDLAGDKGVTQPAIIVPWPGDSSLYYVFTIDLIKPTVSGGSITFGLYTTIIDMKERNGLGDAISSVLNKEILIPVTNKLTAIKHKNGKDFWVITHKWMSDEFYAYLITPYGMAPAVISAVGSQHGDATQNLNNVLGYMKTSPDGEKIALAVMSQKIIELLDFDNETGKVSNPVTYTTTVPGIEPYGVEFSPDSRKLYATLAQTGGYGVPDRPSYIMQFDLSKGLSAPVVLDSIQGVRNLGMQLAPNGRIYISRTISLKDAMLLDSLEVIYNPNRTGIKCNVNRKNGIPGSGQSLGGRHSKYSVPNFVQSYVNVPPFRWDSVCHGDITKFTITNRANIDSVTWDFDDGAFSSALEPVHQYANPGVYKVKLTEYYEGSAFVDTMRVTNYKLPEIGLSDTVLLYTGSSINLHAGGGNMEYLWSTNSTDSIINVSTEKEYRVTVKDFNCCRNSDTTYVKVFSYAIPNAFTPNGDGWNDTFMVNGLYRNIDFSMMIYDRWGRLVFESKNIDKGWNGTFGGQLCNADTYVWMVNIKFRGEDIITKGDVKFKGTVTLVR